MLDLAGLIAPLGEPQFFEEHWEKRPLLLQPGSPERFSDLITFEDVDSLLGAGWLAHPTVRLVKNGAEADPDSYRLSLGGSSGPEQRANADTLAEHYRTGGTIILNALQRVLPPIAELGSRLEAVFRHPVQTNLYLTPPGGQGFAPHFDTHDVFILQIVGRKTWRLYDRPPVELPLLEQVWKRTAEHPTPPHEALLFETDLVPGDVLYIPRGFVHEARASDQKSLHLTVGILVRTYLDVFREVLESLSRSDVRLRRALPCGYQEPGAAREAAASAAQEIAAAIASRDVFESALARLKGKARSQPRPLLGGRLAQTEAAERLSLDSSLERRPGVLLETEVAGGHVRLYFGGKTVDLPEPAGDLVGFVERTRRFRVSELPPALGPAGNLMVARMLIREGLLLVQTPTG